MYMYICIIYLLSCFEDKYEAICYRAAAGRKTGNREKHLN